MQHVLEAIQAGASSEEFAALAVPESYRGAHVLKSEIKMFEGLTSDQKDPRRSIHVGDVPTPEIAPDEAYVAVMASSINFNTVWSSIFEPVDTFGPMERLAREGQLKAFTHEGFWQCMDTYREQQLLDRLWQGGQAPWKKW